MSFASYYVAYQLKGDTTWTITDSVHTAPITQSTLVNWNTNGVATGHYNMILVIKDNYGDSVTVPSGLNVVDTGGIGIVDTGGVSAIRTMQNSDVNVFPNPACNQLFIESSGKEVSGINIYNSIGDLVCHKTKPQNNCIDISHLTNGVYAIEIITPAGSVRKSWVKM